MYRPAHHPNFLRFTLSLLLTSVLLTSPRGFAGVPHLIRYQGQAVDAKGLPLQGPYTLTFRLYNAETAGAKLWEETQPNIPVTKGHFSTLLGQLTSLDAIDWSQPLWLALKVGTGDDATNPELSPRQQITSVPLALRAQLAEQLAGPITTVGNNVGIGTASPQSTLTIGTSGAWGPGGSPSSLQIPSNAYIVTSNSSNTAGIGMIKATSAGVITLGDQSAVTDTIFTTTSGEIMRIRNGNVGIGTTNPGAKLDVAGNVKITDGTQGVGKVLTSDANGVASWQANGVPAGAVILWTGASCPAGYTRLSTLDGKFLVGGTSYNAAAGGSNTHDHGGQTGSHVLTIAEIPAHTHGLKGHANAGGEGPNWFPNTSDSVYTNTESTGGGAGHTHPISSADNRPEFATVLLCQKD